MLQFNTILHESAIEPKSVQLVRHQARGPTGKTPYSLWRTAKDQFELYQSLQKRSVFKREWLACFIVTPEADTLFVGMYRNDKEERSKTEETCPVMEWTFSPGSMWRYELSPDQRLRDLSARLVVDWGAGYRSWTQRADRQNKTVLELRRQFREPAFPGFDSFAMRVAELGAIHSTWKTVLSAVRGVYLLTFDDGQQYIGSASGELGFFQR